MISTKVLRRFTAALLAASLLTASGAQEQKNSPKPDEQPAARFTARSELVLVPAVVTDRSGAHIPNLTKDDFIVEQNGVEQKIAAFEEIKATAAPVVRPRLPQGVFSNLSPVNFQPRRINIIVLDTINTEFTDQAWARRELLKYLAESVNTGDLTTLLTLHRGGIRVVHDFTTDPAVLVAALKRVRGAPGMSEGENTIAADDPTAALSSDAVAAESDQLQAMISQMEARSARMMRGFSIQYTLDAFQTIARAYAGVPGRKALIWMTGSFPFPMDQPGDVDSRSFGGQFEHVFQLLNDANIALYPVDARGLVTLGPSAASSLRPNPRNPGAMMASQVRTHMSTISTMQTFAAMTGGEAFYNTNDLNRAVRRASEDSSAYYMLAYYLKPEPEDAKKKRDPWRKLTVKVKRSGAHVRARSGFYIQPPAADEQTARTRDLRSAVTSPLDYTALPLQLRFGAQRPAGKKRAVEFEINVAANAVSIDVADNNHLSLEVVAMVSTPESSLADNFRETIEGHVKPENRQKIMSSGITYRNLLNVAPGEYSVKLVVRDNLSGRMGSLQAPLTVSP